MTDPSVALAFLAGLVSFLSPCVLPLVPGYLSYMSGIGGGDDDGERTAHPGVVAVTFVAGFTCVFVALGATATLLGFFLKTNQTLLIRVGGVFIILMGLVFMGVLKVPFLYREARFHPTPGAGLWGSFVLGAAFAFGWSPCIGATMGAVLTMAAGRAATGGPAEGAALLAVYSLGLGVPFIFAGLGVARLTGFVGWFRKHVRMVNLVSGALLVVVGVLFLTDRLFQISIWMRQSMTAAGLDFWSF
ncbi:MAG: cytochrome c biogenesis CcdA family protein [Actinomycetota bacterium]